MKGNFLFFLSTYVCIHHVCEDWKLVDGGGDDGVWLFAEQILHFYGEASTILWVDERLCLRGYVSLKFKWNSETGFVKVNYIPN